MRISERDSTIFIVVVFLIAITYLTGSMLQVLKDVKAELRSEAPKPRSVTFSFPKPSNNGGNSLIPPPPALPLDIQQ